MPMQNKYMNWSVIQKFIRDAPLKLFRYKRTLHPFFGNPHPRKEARGVELDIHRNQYIAPRRLEHVELRISSRSHTSSLETVPGSVAKMEDIPLEHRY